MEILLIVVFSCLLLCGVLLALIPSVPAMLYMLIVATLFGFVDQFTHLTLTVYFILVSLYVISFLVDLLSGALGAKYGGASLRSILFGIIGAFVGTLLLPPFGGLLGLFGAILASEFLIHNDHKHAFRAATLGVLGAAVGVVINSILATVFFVTFLLSVIF
ncbi:MAG: hypothetical protein A2664_03770 [Candidatus Taylorbacteria bacterium RIFCSPHIGHO2_01_FULL_46_22b]|uniref:DUF456 domain-containing protein n=1 Tax=Candidatus Taylorbacteria bacterium RIFCSPHIGHO2_01_FULL_46_22b TaxID=1802301 RepID=A0A1G2M1R1_9BACT|nr:MAG: hypothetical protein A2664_03770 [Candidatus Taylorbacteria bacterium RIFCSPHIGHO2_01_FULL_46_22b]